MIGRQRVADLNLFTDGEDWFSLTIGFGGCWKVIDRLLLLQMTNGRWARNRWPVDSWLL
jgi:hypothetical protein